MVRVGEWDTKGETEPYLHQDSGVEKIVIHENFDASTLFNDVALVFLKVRDYLWLSRASLGLCADFEEMHKG